MGKAPVPGESARGGAGGAGPYRTVHPRSRSMHARVMPMGKAANLFFCSRGWASGVAHPSANWVGMGGGGVGGGALGVGGKGWGVGKEDRPFPTPNNDILVILS
jgi:hypothetical protein